MKYSFFYIRRGDVCGGPVFASLGSGNIISVLLLVKVRGSLVVLAVERQTQFSSK